MEHLPQVSYVFIPGPAVYDAIIQVCQCEPFTGTEGLQVATHWGRSSKPEPCPERPQALAIELEMFFWPGPSPGAHPTDYRGLGEAPGFGNLAGPPTGSSLPTPQGRRVY